MIYNKFNIEKFMSLAEKRKNRSLEKISSQKEKDKIYKKYYKDTHAIVSMQKLNEWIESRKCRLYFAREHSAVQGTRIVIDSRLNPTTQLCYLIHEIGHLLVQSSTKSYAEKFPKGYVLETDEKKYSRELSSEQHRIDVVAEEFEAWIKGKKLAQKLGVYVNETEFNKRKTEALKSYFKWALKFKEYQ